MALDYYAPDGLPDNWDYESPECSDCRQWERKYEEKMEVLEEQFLSIVKLLYTDEPLDKLDQEVCDMADLLDIRANKLPINGPMVEKKRTEIYKFATELAQIQRIR